jgi:hypothetical protein
VEDHIELAHLGEEAGHLKKKNVALLTKLTVHTHTHILVEFAPISDTLRPSVAPFNHGTGL